MTNPSDPISPFSGSASGQPAPAAPEEFSIHTMEDDLKNLQQGGKPVQEKEEIFIETAHDPEPQKKQFDPKETSSEVVHPFFEQVATPKQDKKNAPANTAPKEITEITASENIPFEEHRKAIRIITAIIAFLVVAILGLGGYYFFITKTPQQTPQQSQNTVEAPTQETPVTIEPPIEKYSSSKPNYLPLDIATLTTDEIKNSLTNISSELRSSAAPQSLYEFIVVDANNNPIAFPIFATAVKLNLSPVLLADMAETFSFYFYNDSSGTRVAIAANIAKKEALAAELTKQEKTFVTDAGFLFLGETPEKTDGIFADSAYNNSNIRFININQQKTLSIDYAIKDSQLIIATSKNAMRAVLDKKALEETQLNIPASTNEKDNSSRKTEEIQTIDVSTSSQQAETENSTTTINPDIAPPNLE